MLIYLRSSSYTYHTIIPHTVGYFILRGRKMSKCSHPLNAHQLTICTFIFLFLFRIEQKVREVVLLRTKYYLIAFPQLNFPCDLS